MRHFRLPALLAVLVAMPSLVPAQTLGRCEGYAVNARNIMMPPEIGIRSFANGAIRVFGLDTIEPVCCWAHLMVEYPQPGEPYPACVLISGEGGAGFAGLDMANLTARYDPAEGLTVTVPAGRYDPQTGASLMSPMDVTINQATGAVKADW